MTKIHGMVYIVVGVLLIAGVQYFTQTRSDDSLKLFSYLGGLMILVGVGKMGINALRNRSGTPKAAPRPVYSPRAAPGGRFCPQCGAVQPPHARFCSNCGTPL